MQTLVPVVDALPKMDVRLDHPPTSAATAEEDPLGKAGGEPAAAAARAAAPETVVAFKGQILHWRLYCVSSGETPSLRVTPDIVVDDELLVRSLAAVQQQGPQLQRR